MVTVPPVEMSVYAPVPWHGFDEPVVLDATT